MSKKKTHEEYVNELKDINADIEVVGIYVDYKTPILHRCTIHNIEWNISPGNALSGKSCRLCKGDKIKNSKKMSHTEYVERLSIFNFNVDVIEQYVNAHTPILHRCKIHDIKWMVRPADVLRGDGCKQCHLERFSASKSKTHDEYASELKIKNINVEVIGTYVKAKTPITHMCLVCGNKWEASPDNILQGTGCPVCNISHGEKEILDYLCRRSISYIPQFTFAGCKNKKLLPFDFYLPEYNLCIEYDGIQHYEPVQYFGGDDALKKRKHNDSIKTNYCLSNKIGLIRIKYNQDVVQELDIIIYNTKLIKEVI